MADVVFGTGGGGAGDTPVPIPPIWDVDWCEAFRLDFPTLWAQLTNNGVSSPTNEQCYIWYNTFGELPPEIIGPPQVQPAENLAVGVIGLGLLISLLTG